MIHGTIEYGPPKDALARRSFFHKVSYLIDGYPYSLHEIEHGVLRCNRRPPGALFKAFKSSDPRAKYILPKFDARIHFALVCGAKSCPPIKVYNAENIDEALQLATESFINEETVIKQNEIILSRLFDWFSNDFGNSQEEVLSFILSFCKGDLQAELTSLLALENGQRAKVSFHDYDWNLNVGSMASDHQSFL